MTTKRAAYILACSSFGQLRFSFDRNGGAVHSDGITPAEHEAIRQVWRKLPGWTCYADAVAAIAYPERWPSITAAD